MLKDCIEIFEKEIDKYKKNSPNGDEFSFITDNYSLTTGSYYLLDIETGEIKETLNVDKDTDSQTDLYRKFAKLEYISLYIDSNKAISDKNIFSNNIYSFIAKKENIADKINEKVIDEYFDKIMNFQNTPDTNKKKIYKEYEEKIGTTNKDNANKTKLAIKNFIKNYNSDNQKGRLAVFFDVDFCEYEKESNRYILANIYNCNKYNYQKEGKIYGLPNNNMGLNEKKPFLKNKSRLSTLPYALSLEETLNQKLLFDYLLTLADKKKYYLYFSEKGIKNFGNKEYPKEDINGFFIRIKKGQKECEIYDYAAVEKRTDKISIKIDNILNIQYSATYPQKLNYKEYKSLNELIPVISEILYSNWLESNYFIDAKEIKIQNDSGRLKDIIVKTRNAWVDWFYKGKTTTLEKNFNYFSAEIVKNTIENFHTQKAREQFNLRIALLNYFNKRGSNMSEKIQTIVNELDEKINSKTSCEIQSDDEYYFAVGQLANYFISKNKSTNKSHSLISPILQCKTNKKLKKILEKMFLKYNYSIPANSLRFNNLYGMLNRYKASKQIITDMLLGGYLYQSLIYKKDEGENNE